MFTLTTVLTGMITFFLKKSISQSELIFIGILLGTISSLFVIFEPHKGYIASWFKKKEILETIYFQELQDRFGSLLYFIPATLLFSLLLYFYVDIPINTVLCLIGVSVSLLELRRMRSIEQTLSDHISRVDPFYSILKDQETQIWSINAETPRSSRTSLIQTVLQTLASRNWASFEAVEKNWNEELKKTLQTITQKAKLFEGIWTGWREFIPLKSTPLDDIREKMNEFHQFLSLALDSLWAVGYHLKGSVYQKKFDFLKELLRRLEGTDFYLQQLKKLAVEYYNSIKPSNLKDYYIEAKCLEFLGIDLGMTKEEPYSIDKVDYWDKKFPFVSEFSLFKDAFENLKMASLKMTEIEIEDCNEDEWEFTWFDELAFLGLILYKEPRERNKPRTDNS